MAALVAFIVLAPVSSNGQPAASVLTSVKAVVEEGITVVTIESNGPLPEPAPEVLDGPPRIFFDLTGVRPRRQGATPGAGAVRRARVALRSVNPNVTRVVLDLVRPENYRVHSIERQAGRLMIFVGFGPRPTAPAPPGPVPVPVPVPIPERVPVPPPSAPAIEKMMPPPIGLPTAPDPAAPRVPAPPDMPPAGVAASKPSPPAPSPGPVPRNPVAIAPVSPRPRLPAAEAEVYRVQLAGALERMAARRPVLRSIDAGESIAADTLSAALAEFRDLRRVLERVEPSSVVRPTHDLLIESCTLGTTAVTLRMEAAVDPGRQVNAASAAAGALMLFDLVCSSVGCANVPK